MSIDGTTLNTPGGSGGSVGTDIIQLPDLHSQNNDIEIPMSGASAIYLKSKTAAPIYYEVWPAGLSGYMVDVLDPYDSAPVVMGTIIDHIVLKNLTDPEGLPQGFARVGNVLNATGYVLITAAADANLILRSAGSSALLWLNGQSFEQVSVGAPLPIALESTAIGVPVYPYTLPFHVDLRDASNNPLRVDANTRLEVVRYDGSGVEKGTAGNPDIVSLSSSVAPFTKSAPSYALVTTVTPAAMGNFAIGASTLVQGFDMHMSCGGTPAAETGQFGDIQIKGHTSGITVVLCRMSFWFAGGSFQYYSEDSGSVLFPAPLNWQTSISAADTQLDIQLVMGVSGNPHIAASGAVYHT